MFKDADEKYSMLEGENHGFAVTFQEKSWRGKVISKGESDILSIYTNPGEHEQEEFVPEEEEETRIDSTNIPDSETETVNTAGAATTFASITLGFLAVSTLLY